MPNNKSLFNSPGFKSMQLNPHLNVPSSKDPQNHLPPHLCVQSAKQNCLEFGQSCCAAASVSFSFLHTRGAFESYQDVVLYLGHGGVVLWINMELSDSDMGSDRMNLYIPQRSTGNTVSCAHRASVWGRSLC